MRHYKIYLLPLLLTGCAQSTSTETVITNWVVKSEQCIDSSRESDFRFPSNEWLNNLPKKQQQSVVLYLYQEKLFGCWEKESKALNNQLSSAKNDTLLDFFTGLGAFQKPKADLVKSLDAESLKQLSGEVRLFDLAVVGDQLGF